MSNIEKTKECVFCKVQTRPYIYLIWKDGFTKEIGLEESIRGIRHKGKRPMNLCWFNMEHAELTSELYRWLYQELYFVFDKDAYKKFTEFVELLEVKDG